MFINGFVDEWRKWIDRRLQEEAYRRTILRLQELAERLERAKFIEDRLRARQEGPKPYDDGCKRRVVYDNEIYQCERSTVSEPDHMTHRKGAIAWHESIYHAADSNPGAVPEGNDDPSRGEVDAGPGREGNVGDLDEQFNRYLANLRREMADREWQNASAIEAVKLALLRCRCGHCRSAIVELNPEQFPVRQTTPGVYPHGIKLKGYTEPPGQIERTGRRGVAEELWVSMERGRPYSLLK